MELENVNMVWYFNFYNPDSYEKEVYKVTSVGKTELPRLDIAVEKPNQSYFRTFGAKVLRKAEKLTSLN